ncbi:MAG: caspase family protein, partial [Candidatus Cloacimonetes bacterium]|nr:caspase family protein [Candidatus Cloacimonadota bacterium]
MKKFLLALIIAIFVCSLFAARKALVIGNAAYESKPLRNTINDAEDIAAALRNLDFVVDFRTDLNL